MSIVLMNRDNPETSNNVCPGVWRIQSDVRELFAVLDPPTRHHNRIILHHDLIKSGISCSSAAFAIVQKEERSKTFTAYV